MEEIEWRLTHLQGEYQQKFGKRLTVKQIAQETGLSKNTVGDIANGKVKRPDENTVRLLLDCLSKHLERQLTTNDLWHYITPPIIGTANIVLGELTVKGAGAGSKSVINDLGISHQSDPDKSKNSL